MKKIYRLDSDFTNLELDDINDNMSYETRELLQRKGVYGATLKIMEVFGNRMSHYKCPDCGDYHIGKFTPKR